MEYKLLVISSRKDLIDISYDVFYDAVQSQRGILSVLSIEEKLNIVLENYIEYEQELFKCSLNYAVFSISDWSSIIDEMYTINRRLLNLFSSCRFYIDQTLHEFNSINEGNKSKINKLKTHIQNQYDTNIGYRVCEALRNYSQHRDLPIQSYGRSASRIGNETSAFSKYLVNPRLNIQKLSEDKKFNKTVLNEIKDLGEFVGIKPFVRQYIEGIVKIQIFIREDLREDVEKWKSSFQKLYDLSAKISPKTLGLDLLELDEKGNTLQSVYIADEPVKRFDKLVQKNHSLTNLNLRIISNEEE